MMKLKPVASSLICAALLLTVAPSKAFAQTLNQPAVAPREQNSDAAPAKPKPDLKARFAEEIANAKADTLSAEGIKRLDRERVSAQSGSKPKSNWGKKNVVLAIVAVVVITGLAIVLVHNGVEPLVRCEDDPLAPNCVQ
jgi:hypothetical protein